MKRVVLHIDRLVLRRVRPEDRHAFAEGLRAELAGMLGDPTTATSISRAGTIARLRAGRVPVPPGTSPREAGAGAARRIVQTIRS